MGFYLTLAWRNIWRNRRRSLISIASVVFAVVIAVSMRSMQLGFYARTIDNVVSFETGYLQVHAPGYQEKQTLEQSFGSPDSVAAVVATVPHVTRVAPRLDAFALVSSGAVTDGVRITGIAPGAEAALSGLDKRVAAGRYLAADDPGILLGTDLATHLGLAVGDTVAVLGSGYHGLSAAGRYRVTGLVAFPTPELNARLAYLALPAAQELFGAPDRVTALAVMIDGPRRLDGVRDAVAAALGPRYEVVTWETMMPEMVQYIAMDNASGIIMLLLVYVVVGFGVLGTVLMMTVERTREFGVLVALGMRKRVLAALVWLESMILALLGAVAGMALGAPLLLYLRAHPIHLTGRGAEALARWGFEPILPFSLAPRIFVWQTVTVLAIAAVAVLYPLLRIRRLRVVEAMRKGG